MSEWKFFGPFDILLVESCIALFRRRLSVEQVDSSWNRDEENIPLIQKKIVVLERVTEDADRRELSREEALEQMMEWCGHELQRIRRS